jgi:hypothetical protein
MLLSTNFPALAGKAKPHSLHPFSGISVPGHPNRGPEVTAQDKLRAHARYKEES